jgi:WD40 repeat protein
MPTCWLQVRATDRYLYGPAKESWIKRCRDIVTACKLSVAWSPSRLLLASGSADNTAKIYDVELGQCVHTLQHEGSVLCLSFSNGGDLLASGSTDRTVRVWQPVSEPASPVAGVDGAETTSTHDRSTLCKVCWRRGLEVVFNPCRHVVLCAQCAVHPMMTSCPICRGFIASMEPVYVP